MSKLRQLQPCDEIPMKNDSRAAISFAPARLLRPPSQLRKPLRAAAAGHPSADEASPIRLGLASYTFRNFSRAQMIGFMKQLNVFALNAKDVKDHLPTDPQEEATALADYAAAGIKLHAAGSYLFPERRRCRHSR